MVQSVGAVPWIALILAVSFGLYGAIRKKLPVDGLAGLSVETVLLVPVGVGYLGWLAPHGDMKITPDHAGLVALVALSGVVTAMPLLCFGQAARRLPLSTLGFLQYLAPSLQLGLAVVVFDERPTLGWWNFALIWTALAIFSIDSLLAQRKAALQPAAALAVNPQAAE
jgi:chloramphenicol-sensitive protein RarD